MNIKAFLNTITNTARAMPVVIFYVTEGCNLKCLTCSYRKPLPGELTFTEIKELARELKGLGLKHIVYSGGEPLLRRDFPEICGVFSGYGVKQTLLTNGLLLEKRINEIKNYFSEIIVSIDGANAQTHNRLRGVNSFDIIFAGVKKTIGVSPAEVSIRTVLQKQNFRELEEFIQLAKSAGVKRISFLAADVSSEAYGREKPGEAENTGSIALSETEVTELKEIINSLAVKYREEFAGGLISESPEKLHHIADYYHALGGKSPFPRNTCNAPMISAVITSTGIVHPCFFLPAYGNLRKENFSSIINSPSIKQTRRRVRNYEPAECQRCVCTLYTSPANALKNKF